ncbi:hypothetical protein KUTeg_018074 [Tegillarca granosa]|uniref:DNA repair protein REV1 n=1 Tax=Tegillarca granosa TaxID=220873 RepID=A0ABQ9EGU5_TEGGR|nr:hypothetical protein KUTeg_018074 [Tegillarca granosa]
MSSNSREPSSDELKRLMMLHGGSYEHYMSKTRVTHVIATSLASSKVNEFKHMKMIRPEWITDSVKSGRLLSYVPYQLYTAQTGIQQGLSSFTSLTVTQRSTITNNTQQQSSNTTASFNGRTENQMDRSYCGSIKGNLAAKSQELGENLIENTASKVTQIDKRNNSHITVNDKTVDSSFKVPNDGEYTLQETEKVKLAKTTATAATSCQSSHSPAKAGDPDFLSEFYSNSRLHHLSTWKSEWRAYVNKLQKQGSSFPGRQKLYDVVKEKEMEVCQRVISPLQKAKPQRIIMHIDMDCFFVSVGLKRRPELKGKPVVVTHSRGKGMAKDTPGSDVQFERRQWELRRQQGGKKGKRKLSSVSDQQPSEDIDDRESDDIGVDIVARQQTSPGGSTFHSMAEIASCSYEARKCGVRNGMFMGKAKQLCPDLVTIPYDFEGYQDVSKILYDTVASYTHDIEAVSCDEMLVDCTDLLTTTGSNPVQFASMLRDEIYNKTGCTASAGMGSNILLAKMATKKAKPNGQYYLGADEVLEFIHDQSIDNIPGKNYTVYNLCLAQPLGQDDMEAEHFLTELSEEVHNRLFNIDMKGKSITLKIMSRRADAPQETAKFMGHGICNNTSKSVMLPIATDDSKIISRECITILRNLKVKATDLRGIGIQVQKLEPSTVKNNNVKGAQSILNFAVPKSKEKVVSPQENNNTSSYSDKRIINGTSPVHDYTAVLQPYDTPQSDENYISHDNVDVIESSQDDHQEINGNSEVFHGIVGELARRKTAKKILPPLPSMDDLSLTPEGADTLTSSGRPRRKRHQVIESEDYFPSPSQSCLNALPVDLQKELREAYAQQTEQERNKTASNAASMWLPQSNSPSKKPSSPLKAKSPGKTKKNSPVFKVPQGRPVRGRKKLSPKKLKFQKQPKIDITVSGRKESVPMFDNKETTLTIKEIPGTSVMTSHVDQPQKSVNLCGAVSIADVKTLLREWLQSSTTPEKDDEEIMIEYLTDLVFDHNLEQVDLVLKFLNRNICKMNRVNWRPSLWKIIDAVQVVVQSMYGCQLGLPTDFGF